MSIMQNLVPQFILENHIQGVCSGSFEAASLFADISGFSAMTHALAQRGGSEAFEVMADVMLAIFSPLVDAVYAQSGFIATFAGDAFTALFPVVERESREDSLLRAISAARAVQQELEAHPLQTTSFGQFTFSIKLGLGFGTVEWGILRPTDAKERDGDKVKAAYFFSGTAIEAAVGAEHHAINSNLVISPVAVKLLGTHIQSQSLDGSDFKIFEAAGKTLPSPNLLPADTLLDPALQAVLPDFIANSILELETHGEFRQVVSVFVSLMGIENVQDLDIFIQAVFNLQREFGGYLSRVDFGDKGCNLLLFWGAPTSFENDLQRALQFVLELGNDTPGSFRAGVTSQRMYAGLAGSLRRGEFTVYGDGINLAARLMQAAPWGSIWLDEQSAGHAGRGYVIQEQEQQVFKGFSEPQRVFALMELSEVHLSDFYEGTMVGREREWGALSTFIQPLLSSKPVYTGALIVQGEAGLGKSRLVTEFLLELEKENSIQWILCPCNQTVQASFNPFRYWLHSYFSQSRSQSVERNKRLFGHKLDQLIANQTDATLSRELNRTRSFLGALVDLYWDNSLYNQLDEQGRYNNLILAMLTLMKAESLRKPLVILLEDIQWLDNESRDFLEHLGQAASLEGTHFLLAVLSTARPMVNNPPLLGNLPYQRLDLGILGSSELTRIALDILGGNPSPALVKLLDERAEGNPFFAGQILLFLREMGALAMSAEGWQVIGAAGVSVLPGDVRAVFTARLDCLAHGVREAVQTASVLGREFDLKVLAEMLKSDNLSEILAAASNEAIWTTLDEMRYIFRHALLRDAAYEMQLHSKRRELHCLAAESLERLFAADLVPHYAEIAYHYYTACIQGLKSARLPALNYLEKVANQASASFENSTALDHFNQALELVQEDEVEMRWRLLLGCEAILHLTGAREAQKADLQSLSEMAEASQHPADQAEVALRQAKYAEAISDYPGSAASAKQAVHMAQAAGDVSREAAAQFAWGFALWRQANFVLADVHARIALSLAQKAGRRELEAHCLRVLGIISNQWQPDHPKAKIYMEQSLALCREIGDRRGEAAAINNLGTFAYQENNFVLSGDFIKQALAINKEIGDRLSEAYLLINLGESDVFLGDLDSGKGYLEQALILSREIGSPDTESAVLSVLGTLALFQGDYRIARIYKEKAISIARDLGARKVEAEELAALGHLSLLEGNYSSAEKCFKHALAMQREFGLQGGIVENLSGLARVALQGEDFSTVQAYIDEFLPILVSNPNLPGAIYPLRATLNAVQVLRALRNGRTESILEAARVGLLEQANSIPDEAGRRRFLENVPERRDLLEEFSHQTGITSQGTLAVSEKSPIASTDMVSGQPEPNLSADLPEIAARPFQDEAAQNAQPILPSQGTSTAKTEPATSPSIQILPVSLQLEGSMDLNELANKIRFLLNDIAKAEGINLVILGDIHIHQIILSTPPSEEHPNQQPDSDK